MAPWFLEPIELHVGEKPKHWWLHFKERNQSQTNLHCFSPQCDCLFIGLEFEEEKNRRNNLKRTVSHPNEDCRACCHCLWSLATLLSCNASSYLHNMFNDASECIVSLSTNIFQMALTTMHQVTFTTCSMMRLSVLFPFWLTSFRWHWLHCIELPSQHDASKCFLF